MEIKEDYFTEMTYDDVIGLIVHDSTKKINCVSTMSYENSYKKCFSNKNYIFIKFYFHKIIFS